MTALEGFVLRKGILAAGAVLLVAGIIIFLICVVQVSQASSNFIGCLNGFPTTPTYGVPTACSNAMGAMVLYGTLEWMGIIVGIVGFVLLILGILLGPPQPAFPQPAYYPPPVYAPPMPYQPPQGPQAPPPHP